MMVGDLEDSVIDERVAEGQCPNGVRRGVAVELEAGCTAGGSSTKRVRNVETGARLRTGGNNMEKKKGKTDEDQQGRGRIHCARRKMQNEIQ